MRRFRNGTRLRDLLTAAVTAVAIGLPVVAAGPPATATGLPATGGGIGKPGGPCTGDYLYDSTCTYQTRLGTFSVSPMVAVAGGSITGSWASGCQMMVDGVARPCPYNWSSFLGNFPDWEHTACTSTDASCTVTIPKDATTRPFGTITAAMNNEQGTGTSRVYYAIVGKGWVSVDGRVTQDGAGVPGAVVSVSSGGASTKGTADASGFYWAVLRTTGKVTVTGPSGSCVSGTTPCSPKTSFEGRYKRVDFTVGQAPPEPPRPSIDLDLAAIDWSNVGEAFRHRVMSDLLRRWRAQHPDASFEEYRAAAIELERMMTGRGPAVGWAVDAWEALKASSDEIVERATSAAQFTSLVAQYTVEDTINGKNRDAIYAFAEGVYAGGKRGVIGLKDLIVNSPQLVAVSFDYWTKQKFSDAWYGFATAGWDLGPDALAGFLKEADKVKQAANAGDSAKLARIFGEMYGENFVTELIPAGAALLVAKGGARATTAGAKRIAGAMDDIADNLSGKVKRKAPVRPDNEVNVRDLEATYGYPSFTAAHIDEVAKATNTIIEMKPANPASLRAIEDGLALAKPEGIKPKSINDLDVAIGGPEGAEGFTGFFRPTKPAGYAGMDPSDPLRKRYDMRMKQWDSEQPLMQWLSEDPATRSKLPPGYTDPSAADLGFRYQNGQQVPMRVEVRDGLVFDTTTGKPFAGDFDIWAIRDARTGKLLPASEATDVVKRLSYASNPQHGPGTAIWEPTKGEHWLLREKLFDEHSRLNPDAVPLLQFTGRGDGLPRTTYTDLLESNAFLGIKP